MEPGNVIEYIDRQTIVCAVILDIKIQKLSLLNELNREVSLSLNRILHVGSKKLDLALPRGRIVEQLKEISHRQIKLIPEIDIPALWELLHPEQDWIDVSTITGLCFPSEATSDHESAVIRALFQNRLYFKFNRNRFYPYTEEQVEQLIAQAEQAERKKRMVKEGVDWLEKVINSDQPTIEDQRSQFAKILKSVFLREKESCHFDVCKDIMTASNISDIDDLFPILLKLNIFDQNENIDLYRMEIPTDFSQNISEHVSKMTDSCVFSSEDNRRDLTHLNTITIDGEGTQDFDDALSYEQKREYHELGIHIIDVGHFIKKGDALDREAFSRGSSIYMPDLKIPMLPPDLAEDLCSLKLQQLRPAISVLVRLTPMAEIMDYDIFPSIISVKQQLTYTEADNMVKTNPVILALCNIAVKFRRKRLEQGAMHISLPELHLTMADTGEILLKRVNREGHTRMLISEIMIMANWLMAKYLEKNDIPGVFRSQPEPKQRLYKGDEGTLYQNYMQRRLINRFALSEKGERHSGLGLDAYVTATSPIRKYFDLVTQRQIRAGLGLEAPYTAQEINHIIQYLELPLIKVTRIQLRRNRFWILKHLEKKIGDRLKAIVLLKRKNHYQILLPDFMIECALPLPGSIKLKPEDMIHVKIQHVDARKDIISVFMG